MRHSDQQPALLYRPVYTCSVYQLSDVYSNKIAVSPLPFFYVNIHNLSVLHRNALSGTHGRSRFS